MFIEGSQITSGGHGRPARGRDDVRGVPVFGLTTAQCHRPWRGTHATHCGAHALQTTRGHPRRRPGLDAPPSTVPYCPVLVRLACLLLRVTRPLRHSCSQSAVAPRALSCAGLPPVGLTSLTIKEKVLIKYGPLDV
jgi:hypothetical protein